MDRPPRPAIQLYSVHEFPESLPDLLAHVGTAGFEGVEFAHRFREADIDAVANALDAYGIEPVAAHAELPVVEAAVDGENDLLDRCAAVGCDRVIVPHISPAHFRSRSAVQSLAAELTALSRELAEYDVELGYHSMRHDLRPFLPGPVAWAFDSTPLPLGLAGYVTEGLGRISNPDPGTIPDDTGLWNLFARTRSSDLFFELDLGEVQAAGFDPVRALSLFSGRVPAVHLRDVAPSGRFGEPESVRLGDGTLDVRGIADAAADAGVEWIVFEDELDRDPTAKIEDGAEILGRHLERSTGRSDAVIAAED